jgi:hypothetical protein
VVDYYDIFFCCQQCWYCVGNVLLSMVLQMAYCCHDLLLSFDRWIFCFCLLMLWRRLSAVVDCGCNWFWCGVVNDTVVGCRCKVGAIVELARVMASMMGFLMVWRGTGNAVWRLRCDGVFSLLLTMLFLLLCVRGWIRQQRDKRRRPEEKIFGSCSCCAGGSCFCCCVFDGGFDNRGASGAGLKRKYNRQDF